MAGRVKIRSKVVKATLANKDVLEMFQGVLGTSEGGTAALAVAHPKYVAMSTHTDRFVRLLSALASSTPLAYWPDMRAALVTYAATLRAAHTSAFPPFDFGVAQGGRLTLAPADYTRVSAAEAAAFARVFDAAKKCVVVNTAVITCKNLVPHKKSLQDLSQLGDRFLTRAGGLTFAPLPDLPDVNLRRVYGDTRLTAGERQYLLAVLSKMYHVTHDVYEAVSAPDVDVDEFVSVIMSSIGEVKKHIPRCDQAFDKIVESVGLLKGNFGSYYKDFTASGNPTIIMENFVLDVAKNTKATPAVTAQFRRIIGHYRKLASEQSSNPKLQSLFAQVDANFSELERASRSADDDDSDAVCPPGASREEVLAARRARHRARASGASGAADASGAPDASGEGLASEFDRAARPKPGPAVDGSIVDAEDDDDYDTEVYDDDVATDAADDVAADATVATGGDDVAADDDDAAADDDDAAAVDDDAAADDDDAAAADGSFAALGSILETLTERMSGLGSQNAETAAEDDDIAEDDAIDCAAAAKSLADV